MEIKVTDNSKEVLNAFQKQMKLALEAIGNTAEGYAKEDCPVDTGRLGNSITYATEDYSGIGSYSDNEGNSYSDATAKGTPSKNEVYIGTNVEYAEYVEFGDNKNFTSGKAHFLRDAAAGHAKEYENIVETILRN